MGKWFKRFVIFGLVLFGLLLAAAIALPFLLKGKIEPIVKQQVNDNVNATVEWGDWDISIFRSFPDLTVIVNDVVVCNKAPFDSICLARIGEVTATVDIMSAFRDRIQIKRIGLDRPNIHVKVLEDGVANYNIAMESTEQVEEPAADTSSFSISLKEYWIKDGHIVYEDASLPMTMTLAGVDHNGSGDLSADFFTLSTETTVETMDVTYDGLRYLRRAKADIDADLDMDMANMKFTFKENTIKVNRLELGLDGWVAMPGDPIDMDLKWDVKRNDLDALLSLIPAEFASDLDGVDMQGKVTFNGYVKGTYTEEQMPSYGVNIAVDNGRFKYPDLPKSVEAIKVRASIQSPQGNDMDGMVVDMPQFSMLFADQSVEARLHLSTPISDPNIDTEVKARLDLGEVKQVIPMEGEELNGLLQIDAKLKGRMSAIEAQRYNDFVAEGMVRLEDMAYRSDSLPFPVDIGRLQLALSPQFLALTEFTGSLGSSDIQANGRFDNYLQWWLSDSTITGTFNLKANKFDLNEIMGSDEGTADAGEGAPADTASMEVFEVPGNVDFTLNTEIGLVRYENLDLADMRGTVHIHDRKVDLRGLGFGMLKGQVAVEGSYSTQDITKPMVNMRMSARDMDIESTVASVEMVEKVAPIAKTCKGRFTTSLTMVTELDQHMEPKLNTLTGQGELHTKDVQVDGFQPLVDIAKALKVNEIQNTKIQNVDFSYEFRDGKMYTKPFDVKIDRVKANVSGSTAFEDQAIDYDMKAKVPSDIFGAQASTFVSGLLGQANQAIGSDFKVPEELDITVKITGTIDKPIVKPLFAGGNTNIKETVKEEIKQELNQQIDKAKEDAVARAREEAAKLIAEAQKQADELKASARREAANVKAQAYKAADDELAKITNPLAKAAAKLVADKAKQEADKQEQKAIAEADKRADGIVAEARKQGDGIIQRAEQTNTTIK